ncbi:glutathione S-transferase N-terminal domain-containing protein [Acidocella aromatica]|uniref:Glutathione S-transferase n=1 Tax=Acidocella aromatica TaxID=1303579 RepID=A0A840VNX8_9PROT|nr:glutathione S-transferase N-terminal domain-containing protein [Acidocella aromatica]MBB5372022.1 glutathione S-transferase [Acidocella aromatica]
MSRVLYDLAGADESIRFSPFCWRTKLALAHKNLAFETTPWHFTEKDKIAFSGQSKVPVLVDGEKVVSDSHTIAEYLETTYPNEASLFGEPPARPLTTFIKAWTETVLHPALVPVLLADIHALLTPEDQAYFRQTRKGYYKRSLEDFAAHRAEAITLLNTAMKPLKSTLEKQPFLAGLAPNYADHIVFGALKWATTVSSTTLLEPNGVLERWMNAVLETYGLA